MENFVIGTAGHVDHCKTSLIKALTGINTDTLLEEQRRGISINLGFAYLPLAENLTVGIVDVPGHERFIKNMLAGVCGINLILLTVAADDGIMPQTREHMEIIDFLHIKNIIAVITKTDLVTRERIEEVKAQIRKEFNIEKIVEFSINKPETTKVVLAAIKENYFAYESQEDYLFRLPVDRVFVVKGFGVVVTGSSLSGQVKIGDELEILPDKVRVKVKGIECFNQKRSIAYKHMRVALNLGGVKKEELARGKILASVGAFSRPTKIIDVKITTSKYLKEPLKHLEHLKFYYLAKEIKCQVKLFDHKEVTKSVTVYGQILLDEAIYAHINDLGVLRRLSPVQTIAGVEIINVFGDYVKKNDYLYVEMLKLFEKKNYEVLIPLLIDKHPFITIKELRERLNLSNIDLLLSIVHKNGYVFSNQTCLTFNRFNEIKDRIITKVNQYHQSHPYEQGINKLQLLQELELGEIHTKVFTEILEKIPEIMIINERVKARDYHVKYNQEELRIVNNLKNYLDSFNYKPPKINDVLANIKGKSVKGILYSLIKNKELIQLDEEFCITKDKYEEMIKLFDRYFDKHIILTLNDARDLLDTSRKYLVLFLEYLDKVGYTRRVEEGRVKK